MLSVGLVGLPNAGKSSLFNLLTKRSVPAANFPFTTVDPHDGIVLVPDERVKKLAELCNSTKEVYSAIEFRDIAGLIKDAHQGAGLGNQFLSHIREVDLILMVVRCFENDDIIHVENRINPMEDYEILIMELTMSDQFSLEKIMPKIEKDLRSNDKLATQKMELAERILTSLSNMNPANTIDSNDLDPEIIKWRKSLNLLTDKPIMKLANVSMETANQKFESDFKIDIATENAAAEYDPETRKEFGLDENSGLDKLIQTCYSKLNLATFLTCGEIESRAWTFEVGMNAAQCAGVIHTDFEKNFVKAEVIDYFDFINFGSKKICIENGKQRIEGRDYLVDDGDVIEYRISK
jgi:ribosome-binding ATPase